MGQTKVKRAFERVNGVNVSAVVEARFWTNRTLNVLAALASGILRMHICIPTTSRASVWTCERPAIRGGRLMTSDFGNGPSAMLEAYPGCSRQAWIVTQGLDVNLHEGIIPSMVVRLRPLIYINTLLF